MEQKITQAKYIKSEVFDKNFPGRDGKPVHYAGAVHLFKAGDYTVISTENARERSPATLPAQFIAGTNYDITYTAFEQNDRELQVKVKSQVYTKSK